MKWTLPPRKPPRDQLVKEARELVISRGCFIESGGCVFQAAAIIEVAARSGIKLVLQAGTAMWPFCDPETAPEPEPTHFSYVWEGLNHPAVRARIAQGLLPEIHVWAADPATQAIVDTTIREWPTQAKLRAGFAWKLPPPPDFLWGRPPADVVYKPDRDATIFAHRRLIEIGWFDLAKLVGQ